MAQAVKVMVRVRPMNSKQRDRGCISVVEVDSKNNQINLIKEDTKQQPKSFSFDCLFAPESAQSSIYEQSAFSLVESVLDGYNGTIFAYGQTGCGKTHTMMGGTDSEQSRGIIPRTFSQIITITKNDSSKTHLIRCSFIEIYNEEIHDLLSKDIKAKMELKESPEKGIFVKDLMQLQVDSIAKMQQYMDIGFKNRAVRETNMNKESSRSHSIFTIYIDSQENDDKGNDKYKASKLNLVDLAGSERASKTGTTGDGMKEATKINLSLSALGNVISALVDGKTHHIPYRDSKLTRLLQDSLGGNTKTIMIAAVSPANYNYDETLSTLRYASRAKFIQNKPKVNEDPKDTLLREYMEEINRLKMMLEGKMPMALTTSTLPSSGRQTVYQQKIVYREGQNKENKELQEQLRNKEHLLKNQQEEKRMLREKLQQLQSNFDRKGPDNQDKHQLQKLKKLKQKLKQQKKKQEQFRKQKERRQQQLLHIEKNYKNLNEQVDEMRERFKEIKKKYTMNLIQLKDLQNEHEDEKQELLDTIRYQEKEIKKFTAIMNILMSPDQLEHILNNSSWNDEKRQWNVPAFTYRERMVNFPKVHGMNKQMIEDQKEKKEIVFKQYRKETQKRSSHEGFKVNNIVKNARETTDLIPMPSGQYLRTPNSNKIAHLTPLKSQNYQKVKSQAGFLQDPRRRKMDRLEPISVASNDVRKYS